MFNLLTSFREDNLNNLDATVSKHLTSNVFAAALQILLLHFCCDMEKEVTLLSAVRASLDKARLCQASKAHYSVPWLL